MRGKLHFALGMAAGAYGAYMIMKTGTESTAAAFGISTAIGSIFPDIDMPGSTISRRCRITSTVINRRFGHRGFLHTPLFYAIVFLVIKALGHEGAALYGFCFGAALHILQDMCTRGGIMLFFPILRWRIHLTPFRSGHWTNLLCTLLIGILMIPLLTTFVKGGFL